MTPDDVICGRRREHSSTGLCISNKPTKKPAQSKVWDLARHPHFLTTPELQPGMKRRGRIAALSFQVVLEGIKSKGQKQMPPSATGSLPLLAHCNQGIPDPLFAPAETQGKWIKAIAMIAHGQYHSPNIDLQAKTPCAPHE